MEKITLKDDTYSIVTKQLKKICYSPFKLNDEVIIKARIINYNIINDTDTESGMINNTLILAFNGNKVFMFRKGDKIIFNSQTIIVTQKIEDPKKGTITTVNIIKSCNPDREALRKARARMIRGNALFNAQFNH